MARQRNVGREIALILAATVVLGTGLGAYIWHSVPSREELLASGPRLTGSDAGAHALGTMDAATELVGRFAAALAAKNYEQAYHLMAAPYRENVPLAAFAAKCKASPFLASAQSAALTSTRRTSVAGSTATTFTLQGQGVLVSGRGSLDATFSFLVDNDRMTILVLALAGIPVLDGISGAANGTQQ
jgi:hypothetical protein